jgi:selenocysteine lyase/cysteine desulfurase
MVQLYGPANRRFRGAVVTFNVLDEQGRAVAHETVEAVAREVRVSVRGGCFCNPGAAEQVGLGFGAPTQGAVRASLGVANNMRDVERLVDVVSAVATRRVPNRRPRVSAAQSALQAGRIAPGVVAAFTSRGSLFR